MNDKNKMIELQATALTYFSKGDEEIFFEWLHKIPCVKKIEGHLSTLSIYVDFAAVDRQSLHELLALFSRYGVPLKQLAVLDKAEYTSWFRNKERWWYNAVFEV